MSKLGFFTFWVLLFLGAHLWNFGTAPWNGNGIYDDAAYAVLYLKSAVAGHSYHAAAWLPFYKQSYETLFCYYLWPWFAVFGWNILTSEAASVALWAVTFLFTLLLTHELVKSWVITSVIAVLFTFLPFAFIYSFFPFHYEMAPALAVSSLYFLHLGFRKDSVALLATGGFLAGLCLASSIIGQQYVMALALCAMIYRKHWRKGLAAMCGFGVAAAPILSYALLNLDHYGTHQLRFLGRFMEGGDLHAKTLWDAFFGLPGPRFFIPDTLPIPLPYYFLLVPGFAVAIYRKHFEIVLLATIPVVGVFLSGGPFVEHRLLLGIPFWLILMGFGLKFLSRLRIQWNSRILLWIAAAFLLLRGLLPSLQYIDAKTRRPDSIRAFNQQEVGLARYLKAVVSGSASTRRNEFNCNNASPAYDTLLCTAETNAVLRLFLHDCDGKKVLSFCADRPMLIMSEEEISRENKKAISNYNAIGRDLKLIWESGPVSKKMIEQLSSVSDSHETMSFSFGDRVRMFDVLNIPSDSIAQFQERVRNEKE